ncbi:MAG: type ISP restriction/modification enzyme [Hyphomicrobium sp.]
MMAGKAVLIKDVLFQTLREDSDLTSELASQLFAFRDQLIHDLSLEDFADIYAETIAYGMFAARLHDETLEDFTREEALHLLPKSNPFLRNLFEFVAGPGLPEALRKTVDELAEVFQAIDLAKLFANFGHFTQRNDPFIHFYETFLAKYNPAKRKSRGVWYTPEPVVNFIVRAVDDVLKSEFGLALGLADTSKITVDWDTGTTRLTKKGKEFKSGERHTEKKEVHRVQILDPAAGTGTFLAEVIRQIGERVKGMAPGHWSTYVEKEMIPRLHGFEILMASYAMCHMKLDMMLTSMGYKPTSEHPPRLSVYLTNSLEEGDRVTQTLPFAQWLSKEARQANTVKNDVPVMVVLGNPPYSGHSSNKGDWIEELMLPYKQSPELRRPAQAKWLSDDYVKFIRFAEYMIEKNGEGVLGFITNHSYLDNPTFLDMRLHLLRTFDKINIIDLHGNTKRREVSPDGSTDQNVFDIQQGVAIVIASKRRDAKKNDQQLAQVCRGEVWGRREKKYELLLTSEVASICNAHLTVSSKPWLFAERDQARLSVYEEGFSLSELFSPMGRPASGSVSTQDQFAISWDASEASHKVELLLKSNDETDARKHFKLCSQDQWDYARAKRALATGEWKGNIVDIEYRIFDIRKTVYDSNVNVHRRERLNSHLLFHDNFALVSCRQSAVASWEHVFVASGMIDDCFLSNRTKERSYGFPIYLYRDEHDLDQERRVNMDSVIRAQIEEAAISDDGKRPDEVEIFDYVYGVLHCPVYREIYREFLKIDFPHIPYPPSPAVFWHVSRRGTELRRLHLMEEKAIGETPYPLEGDGDSVVEKPTHEGGAVFINKTKCFRNVPEIAWNFWIGGYQPARKWLNDRKGRGLTINDIHHYQKIIKVLAETDRIMRTIEMPL